LFRIPGAAIVSVASSSMEKPSFTATGASFIDVIVIVTVATSEVRTPSVARYVKLSPPT